MHITSRAGDETGSSGHYVCVFSKLYRTSPTSFFAYIRIVLPMSELPRALFYGIKERNHVLICFVFVLFWT